MGDETEDTYGDEKEGPAVDGTYKKPGLPIPSVVVTGVLAGAIGAAAFKVVEMLM